MAKNVISLTQDFDLDQAIRNDVNAYAGTQSDLSRRICGSAQALSHKLAGFKGQFLRPQELVDLQLNTGSRNVMHAMSGMLGGVYIQLPDILIDDAISKADLEKKVMELTQRLAALFAAMQAATADGVIDDDEQKRLNAIAHEFETAIQEWLILNYRLHRAGDDDV